MPDFNPKDRTIKVIVQAYKLFNSDMSEEDVDKYTALVEDGGFGNGFGEPNRDFETIVYMNKRICWSIELSNSGGDNTNYSVALDNVFHNPDDGNPNFFTKDPLPVIPGTGQVCGTIARNPNLENKTLVLADPMLATGQSMVATFEALKPFGTPKEIHLVSVIGAQAGVDFVNSHFDNSSHLWIATIDEQLNDKGYIIPGLGDAGDLAFGKKLQQ